MRGLEFSTRSLKFIPDFLLFIVSRTNAIGQDGLQVVREVRDDGDKASRLG
jgi:hypothetical protein